MSSSTPENDPEAFLKEVLSKMTNFSDDLKIFLTKENLFSSSVAEELHTISKSVETAITGLNNDLEALGIGDGSPVLGLLQLANIKCSLETLASRVFRQSILPYEPTGAELEETVRRTQYPVYTSLVPALPTGSNFITFNIFLPNERAPSTAANQVWDQLAYRAEISSTANQTARDIVDRIQIRSTSPDGFLIKVVGMNEYLTGETPLAQFLSVREAVRNRVSLSIEIVPRKPADMRDVSRILELGRQIKRGFFVRAGIEPPQELVFETDAEINWDEDLNKIQDRFNTTTRIAGGRLAPQGSESLLNHSDDSDSDSIISRFRPEPSRSRNYSSLRSSLPRDRSMSRSRFNAYDYVDDDDDDELRATNYYNNQEEGSSEDRYHVQMRPLEGFAGRFVEDDDDYELMMRRGSTDLTSQIESFRQSMGIVTGGHNFGLANGEHDIDEGANESYNDDDDDYHANLLLHDDSMVNSRSSMFTALQPAAAAVPPVVTKADDPAHHRRRSSALMESGSLELNDSDEEDLRAFGVTTIPTTSAVNFVASPRNGDPSSSTSVSDVSVTVSPTPKPVDVAVITSAPPPQPVTPRSGARPPPIPLTPKRSAAAAAAAASSSSPNTSPVPVQPHGTPTKTPPSQVKSLRTSATGLGSAQKNKFFRFSALHNDHSDEPLSPDNMSSAPSISSNSHSHNSHLTLSALDTSSHYSAIAPAESVPISHGSASNLPGLPGYKPPPPPPRKNSSGVPSASSSSFPLPQSSGSHSTFNPSAASTPPGLSIGIHGGALPPQPLPPPVPYDTSFKDTSREHLFVPPVIKKIVDYDSGYDSLICDQLPYTVNIQDPHLPSFKVRVHGIDGLSDQVAPRLTPDISKLYVATCLISGDSIRHLSISSTDDADLSVAPRWDETVLPNHEKISYGSILRASKIAFLLVGRSFDRDKVRDTPLAWCTQQVFDGNDNILIGRHSLELWPLTTDEHVDLHARTLSLGASGFVMENRRIETQDDKSKRSKDRKRINTQLNPTLCKGIDLSECSYLFRGTNSTNILLDNPCRLTISFDYFGLQVVAPQLDTNYTPNPNSPHLQTKLPRELKKDERQILEFLLAQDALYILSDNDKKVLWSVRETLISTPIMLPFILQSCDFNNIDMRFEVYRLLEKWSPPENPAQMINLLDFMYSDYRVRAYAVRQLESLSLGHLQMYLLQLTQCLKFESYHNSPLARFLISKAISYPYQIGHFFYWNLKNEMQCDPPFAERFKCILEAFLTYCPSATDQLRIQQQVIDNLRRVSLAIQERKAKNVSDNELNEFYHQQIRALNRDFFARVGKFQSPLNPRLEASQLVVEKCKIMSSKMAPLWLVFKNADVKGDDIFTMFKAGDDLRQDILTLQILRFMDEIWLKNGMDLRLSPYNVIATGMTDKFKGCGMIQVVLNSSTTGGIQMQFGDGALGAFKVATLATYIDQHNRTPEAKANAIENFIRSCAGYCVATYVLGIGDRHNGNIMVSKDGYLFHIDFGHFLGNFKSKLGINRERAAFVFTPEMAFVMGGKNYQSSKEFDKFRTLCFDAYLLLRKHAYELETLFITMVSAGMPELLNKDDINYLRSQLCLDMTEPQATEQFKQELKKAMNSTSRRIDNYLHLLKHSTKS